MKVPIKSNNCAFKFDNWPKTLNVQYRVNRYLLIICHNSYFFKDASIKQLIYIDRQILRKMNPTENSGAPVEWSVPVP